MRSIYFFAQKRVNYARLGYLYAHNKGIWNSFFFSFFLLFILFTSTQGQTVKSDKVDYLPGDTVKIIGEGWNAFETVDLLLVEQVYNNLGDGISKTVTCDATGNFSDNLYIIYEADLGAFFHLSATGQLSQHTCTAVFNDAGGDYGIDFSAYDPEFYRRELYLDFISGNSLPSGRQDSPLDLTGVTYTTSHDKTVESLMPEYLGLGQIVAFEYYVRVDAGGSCPNDEIQIQGEWLTVTTNGGLFGFDGSLGVVAAFVDTSNDPYLIDPDNDAQVTDVSWTLNGTVIESSVELSGMDPGDEVLVEVWLVLQQSIPQGVGGNVKTRLGDAATIGSCEPGKINTGNQEVPLLQVGDFYSANVNLDIAKSDDPDPVIIGTEYTYTIIVHNEGPSVANTVIVTDVLDNNTTYLSHNIIDNIGATTWTFSQAGQVLTFETSFLNIGESVTIEITAKVNDLYTGAITGIAYESGGYGLNCLDGDICNTVNVSSISDDTDPANDNYYEPTGVQCPTISITASSNPETCFENDDGSVTGNVSGGFTDYTVVISGVNGTTLPPGYSDTQIVSVEGGSYLFTDLWAGDFQVDVTDVNGCTAYTTATIVQPDLLTLNVTHTDVSCFEGDNGSIDLTVTGGTSPYSFAWSTTDGAIPLGNESIEDPDGLTAGTYNVIVTDANGCAANTSVIIDQPTLLVVTETHTDILCFGGSSTVTITASGGVPPYTGTGDFQQTVADGNVEYIVTDANGCISSVFVTLTEPEELTCSVIQNSPVSTNGGSDGVATVTALGGNGGYTYL
ncbi:MAG: DUF11 domain-containing protein, partial [Bacteroidetes bacterium]|nr:DUF11 domain-containing protein [Bacteroidota bacterium]